MYKNIMSSIAIVTALCGSSAAFAGDNLDAAIGGGLGGAAGAAVGNQVGGREGAIIGGALGGAGGAAITTSHEDDHHRYDDRRDHYRHDDRDYRHHDYRGGHGCPPGLAKQGRC